MAPACMQELAACMLTWQVSSGRHGPHKCEWLSGLCRRALSQQEETVHPVTSPNRQTSAPPAYYEYGSELPGEEKEAHA